MRGILSRGLQSSALLAAYRTSLWLIFARCASLALALPFSGLVLTCRKWTTASRHCDDFLVAKP
eukprot:3463608-Prymnesium_polylepis.5